MLSLYKTKKLFNFSNQFIKLFSQQVEINYNKEYHVDSTRVSLIIIIVLEN